MQTSRRCLLAVTLILIPAAVVGQTAESVTAPTQPAASTKDLRMWIAMATRGNKEFNHKLALEGNRPLTNGLNVGIEISPMEILLPAIKANLRAPLCMEYLGGHSSTAHSHPGGIVTVKWEIPIVGACIAPSFGFFLSQSPTDGSGQRTPIKERLHLRPIGIGIYTIGRFKRAQLTVDDRPGSLSVHGDAVGVTSSAAFDLVSGKTQLTVEGGYRSLRFTSLSVRPEGGFTDRFEGGAVQTGTLPESLDYSGPFIRIGAGLKF